MSVIALNKWAKCDIIHAMKRGKKTNHRPWAGSRSKRGKPTLRLRPSLFWDVDPKTIDLNKHAQYVIERILDFGNDAEVRWLWNYYNHRKIRNVVKKSRGMTDISQSFWEIISGITSGENECRRRRPIHPWPPLFKREATVAARHFLAV